MILIILFVITEIFMQFLIESLKKEILLNTIKTNIKGDFIVLDILQNVQ